MTRTNCWQFKNCGRQPGGDKVFKMGLCPACIENQIAGLNHGDHGRRACWAVHGTYCGWKINGTYEDKMNYCHNCDFYKLVLAEEGPDFQEQ